MFSRAWTYWGNSETQPTEETSNEREKPTEDQTNSVEKKTSLTDETPLHPATTATTSDHPYPLSQGPGDHVYSISAPLLKDLKNSDNKDATDEKHKDFKQSLHYTFDPIRHHYDNNAKDVSATKVVVWHSAPLSLSLSEEVTNTDISSSLAQMQITEKKTTDKEENNNNIMSQYLDTLTLESNEKEELMKLHEWIKSDALSNKLKDELCFADIILSYFSSFSPNNPDAVGCWKRWVMYRNDSPLKDVNFSRVREFFDSGVYGVGYDKENRPILIINSKHYKDSFGPEITAKATILFVTSVLWNIRNNSYEFDALRKGFCICKLFLKKKNKKEISNYI
ncbi:hypothetical protein RFI_05057 [Reticulomyxa filosa]|uniref:Uncharacterized protein n=1 Tax=Reticulomyxa filosa TaxID=46433 RepID=X6P1D4_RETFI|nr:hypothetical protein RFI_05057 [Reticulomyxa filosa]|eukprot:ETO32061.1 hypothetical protein RFI_05057 [Reticulomyxa filosa]